MSYSREPMPSVRQVNGVLLPSRYNYGEPRVLSDSVLVDRVERTVLLHVGKANPYNVSPIVMQFLLAPVDASVVRDRLSAIIAEIEAAQR